MSKLLIIDQIHGQKIKALSPKGEYCFLSMLPTAHHSDISHQVKNILLDIDVVIVGNASDGESTLNKLEYYRPSIVMSFPKNYLKILQVSPQKGSLTSLSH